MIRNIKQKKIKNEPRMKLDYKKYMENNEENMHVDNEAFSL